MIQTPGKHVPTTPNRSSKQDFILTRSGIRMLWDFNRKAGVTAYSCRPKQAKTAKKPGPAAN